MGHVEKGFCSSQDRGLWHTMELFDFNVEQLHSDVPCVATRYGVVVCLVVG